MKKTATVQERETTVRIPVGAVWLEGELALPPGAPGIVVFAHGSGSSRHSPRNRQVAGTLQAGGLATLLFNRQALERLAGPKRLEIVPGATHLFEEPGALEEVARLALGWFLRYFRPETERPA